MTPRQIYADLIRQGYSPERAADRSGYRRRGAQPPRVLAPIPGPRPPQQRRHVPNDAQRAWAGKGFERKPRPRDAAVVPLERVQLPTVLPAERPRPAPAPAPKPAPAAFLALAPKRGVEWQESALCAQTDPEAFFPEKGQSTREAKRTCVACPVRVECLRYALDSDERFGVWGGLSERERRRLKKRGGAA